MSPRAARIALGFVLLFAFLVRAPRLDAMGYYLDEFVTVDLARAPLDEYLRRTTVDLEDSLSIHTPLVGAALRVRDHEVVARLPSLVCGLAMIGLTFALARRLLGPMEGVLAASLLAISPEHVRYSAEARPYTLMGLLVLACWLAVLAALEGGRLRTWAVAGALAAAAFYAHATSLLATLAAVLVGLAGLVPRARRGERARGLGVAVLAGVLVGLPVLLLTLEMTGRPMPEGGGSLLSAVDRERMPIFEGDFWFLQKVAGWLGPGRPLQFAVPGALALAGFVVLARRHRPGAWLLGLAVLVPLVVAFTIPFGHGFGSRYLFFLHPVVAVLASAGLVAGVRAASRGGPVLRGSLAGAGLVVLGGLYIPALGHEDHRQVDARGVARALLEDTDARPVLLMGHTRRRLADLGALRTWLDWYLPEGGRVGTLDAGEPTEDLDAALAALEPFEEVHGALLHGPGWDRASPGFPAEDLVRCEMVVGVVVLHPSPRATTRTGQRAAVLAALSEASAVASEGQLLMQRALDAALAEPLDARLDVAICASIARRLVRMADELDPGVGDGQLIEWERAAEGLDDLLERGGGGAWAVAGPDLRAASLAFAAAHARYAASAREQGFVYTAASQARFAAAEHALGPEFLRALAEDLDAEGATEIAEEMRALAEG